MTNGIERVDRDMLGTLRQPRPGPMESADVR